MWPKKGNPTGFGLFQTENAICTPNVQLSSRFRLFPPPPSAPLFNHFHEIIHSPYDIIAQLAVKKPW